MESLGLVDGMNDVVDAGVAVAVDRELVTSLMVFADGLYEVVSADSRVASVIRVAVKGDVVGFAEIAGEALDTAVGNDLDRAESNAVTRKGVRIDAAVE
jgi:hypothetical protein